MGRRRPHQLRLGLKFNGLGVGYPVTKSCRFASTDDRGAGVKTKDRKLPASKLFDSRAVLLVLLLRASLCRLAFHASVKT
jgi:hypothetical protein